jgi:transposase-like protein
MGRGRPPLGLGHVDSLPGDDAAKERMRTVLATLTGDLTVSEACERLSVSETRFHDLRRTALEAMLEGLTPKPSGRPREPEEDEEVQRLRQQNAWLTEELEIARLRTEIAVWKPSLLRPPAPPGKKGGSSSSRKRRRRRDAGKGGT